MKENNTFTGHIMDIFNRKIIDGTISVENGKIKSITPSSNAIDKDAPYFLPGFIDSQVHIESSMMLPTGFARLAVCHGTTGLIADPHEIANVLGMKGVDFMIKSSEQACCHFAFGLPSCVPSCSPDFETSGATIDSKTTAEILKRKDIHFLGEMMNYPGVLNNDPEVMAKIEAAKKNGKPIDGHAPGLNEEDIKKYAQAGITTNHEDYLYDNAASGIENGIMIQILEGSAEKNFDNLVKLIGKYPDMLMFCTDDSHPSDLIKGHIDKMVRKAISLGYDIWNILQIACINPVIHYNQPWGMLREGDPADFICISDLSPEFKVCQTYISGKMVYSDQEGITNYDEDKKADKYPNVFVANKISVDDIKSDLHEGDTINVIRAFDGSLFTEKESLTIVSEPKAENPYQEYNIQKIVVLNRYTPNAKPQIGYISGFNIKDGALGESIAHDCHNIVAIGTSDELLCKVINNIIDMKGGIAVATNNSTSELPLPIAGIMSPLDGNEIAKSYTDLSNTIKNMGCSFNSPFITLAFMCLPVIPKLKLTDKGLMDVEQFKLI